MMLDNDLSGYLVLEEQMACGKGVCMGCAVEIEENAEKIMKMVCKDGPVFPVGSGKGVIFE